MEPFKDAAALLTFVRDIRAAALPTRMEAARKFGIDEMFYEGMQWISEHVDRIGQVGLAARRPSDDPDSVKFRVTVNRISRFIQKVAAATHTETIEPQVSAPPADASAETLLTAAAAATALEDFMDASAYTLARRDANFRRCICGTHGVGLHLDRRQTRLQQPGPDGQPVTQLVDDVRLKAFDFDPLRLTLDPTNTSRRLTDHEYVLYSDVWTAGKIQRVLGQKLDEDKLPTIASLVPMETDLGRLSSGRLYARYRAIAQQKGAIVHQLYMKGPTGRFDYLYEFVELRAGAVASNGGRGLAGMVSGASRSDRPTADAKDILLITDLSRPDNPFGGDGMPLTLLHGHRRSEGPWSISDVTGMIDDQKRVNIMQSSVFRVLKKYAGWQFVMDRRALGAKAGYTEDQFRTQVNNLTAGVLFYDSGNRDRPASPPKLVNYPPPDPTLFQLTRVFEDAMRENVHRNEINFGVTKTHVTNDSTRQALSQSDQVLGIRASEDLESDVAMSKVMLGTIVRLARGGSPWALGRLRMAGLDALELGLLAGIDEVELSGLGIQIRESSVRYRSRDEKRSDLMSAAAAKAIGPEELRDAFAGDLDTPLTVDDRLYYTAAQRAAAHVVAGETWQPRPLGPWTRVFLAAFRRAQFSKAAERDPSVLARLAQAIEVQRLMALQEMAPPAGMVQPGAPGQPGLSGAAPQPGLPQGPMDGASPSAPGSDTADLASLISAVRGQAA